jgi:hypothetical protein
MGAGNNSEVARLKAQIEDEFKAGHMGLYGLAEGTSRHAFITSHLERVERHYSRLSNLIGEERATDILVQASQTIQ